MASVMFGRGAGMIRALRAMRAVRAARAAQQAAKQARASAASAQKAGDRFVRQGAGGGGDVAVDTLVNAQPKEPSIAAQAAGDFFRGLGDMIRWAFGYPTKYFKV